MAVGQVSAERRKELGAFFTPPAIATALAQWAIRSPNNRVLEPAAGEAVFLIAAGERLQELGKADPSQQVVGVEIDKRALDEARSVTTSRGYDFQILHSDFFDVEASRFERLFDACIGNPPYVRYHRFRGEARSRGQTVASSSGVQLSGLASSWAPFVVHAAEMVAPGGRLALVLPAELLHVDYAAPIREFLQRRFGSVTVATFDEAIFPGAMIDTVLLLAEDGPKKGLRVVTFRNASDLDLTTESAFTTKESLRWSGLRVPGNGAAVLERLRADGRLAALSTVASVDIGFVTGANHFFVVTHDEARRRKLPRRALHAVIARPAQLYGAVVEHSDVAVLAEKERSLLLRISKPGLEKAKTPVGRYLRRGRRLGVARAYKCRVRDPWYEVPGVRIPDAFLSYMSHRAPRVALNTAGLSSTNLVHQVTFDLMTKRWAAAYVAALHSSLSHLSFEIEGRSYGGGVLKHETREAERVLIPVLTDELADALAASLPAVDAALRAHDEGKATSLVDEVLVRQEVVNTAELLETAETTQSLRARRALRGKTKT